MDHCYLFLINTEYYPNLLHRDTEDPEKDNSNIYFSEDPESYVRALNKCFEGTKPYNAKNSNKVKDAIRHEVIHLGHTCPIDRPKEIQNWLKQCSNFYLLDLLEAKNFPKEEFFSFKSKKSIKIDDQGLYWECLRDER